VPEPRPGSGTDSESWSIIAIWLVAVIPILF
jgi:hypothetical protein